MRTTKNAKRGTPSGSKDLPPGTRIAKITRIRDFGSVSNVALDAGGSLQFTLDQVPGHPEITAMYDGYSIDQVDVTFTWVAPFSSTTSASAVAPIMMLATDYDDALPPTTSDQVGEFSTARLRPFSVANNTFTVSVKPRVAMQLFRSGVTSAYGWGKSSQIVDAANIDVPHYGLKWFTKYYNTGINPSANINIHLKFHLTLYASR